MKFNNTNIFQRSALLVASLLLSLLSACGGGAAGGAGPAGTGSDTTAPITTVAPAISGTSGTATTLSVTINENGTGYYLVLPFAATAPSFATVQTGTAFSMTANVAATPAIIGLTPVTPYMIYFVAKDAANNVQAAVQSVPVTTTAVSDTTAPITMAAPAVSGTSDTATTLSVTINENGTGYYLVLPFAATVPSSATVQEGIPFAMTANVAATPAISGLTPVTPYMIYFVAKDAANNVQAAVQSVPVTTIAPPDTIAPITTVVPAVSGTSDIATTLSVTINENGTGYYLVKPVGAADPTPAEVVQAGIAFPMTANVAATLAISGLTPITGYMIYFVAKDTANNVQAAWLSAIFTTLLQGGLNWIQATPPSQTLNWAAANSYCTTTPLNGQPGWRLPTSVELSALYTAYPNTSQVLANRGLSSGGFSWSSTQYSTPVYYYIVDLSNGSVSFDFSSPFFIHNVLCVR